MLARPAELPPEVARILVVALGAILLLVAVERLRWPGLSPRRRRRPPTPGPSWTGGPGPTPPGRLGRRPLGLRRNGQRGRLSQEYLAYIRSPAWRAKVDAWKAEHRARGGTCELAPVLARGGYPHCGGREPLGRIDGDHRHYRTLGRESRADVAMVCRQCHETRTALARRGVDVWERWGP